MVSSFNQVYNSRYRDGGQRGVSTKSIQKRQLFQHHKTDLSWRRCDCLGSICFRCNCSVVIDWLYIFYQKRKDVRTWFVFFPKKRGCDCPGSICFRCNWLTIYFFTRKGKMYVHDLSFSQKKRGRTDGIIYAGRKLAALLILWSTYYSNIKGISFMFYAV